MFCKYCGSKLPEDSTVCANCGKDTEEVAVVEQPEIELEQPAEKKKTKRTKLVLAITAGVVMFALLVGVIFASFNGGLFPRENNVFYKDTYTAAGWWVRMNGNTVVSTMGEYKLTNKQLQVFYWMQVYEFLNTNSAHLSEYGLDISQPLDKQVYNTSSGLTWQQVFLEDSLASWQRYTALADEAKKAGYQMDAQYQEYLDNLKTNMEKSAQEDGYASLDEMLENDMGPGVDFDAYYNYLYHYYLGNLYFQSLRAKLEATDAEIEEFYKTYEDILKEDYGVSKDSDKVVDVRHILIMPEGGTLAEDGVTTNYSDAEWEACRVKAQKLLDQWIADGKKETKFAELAAEHSADGSAEAGGLIESIAKGTMVAEFNDWCFDETRQTGDYGLVKTVYGYHLMYFVGSELDWIRTCRDALLSQKSENILKELEKTHPDEVAFNKIVLGTVELK